MPCLCKCSGRQPQATQTHHTRSLRQHRLPVPPAHAHLEGKGAAVVHVQLPRGLALAVQSNDQGDGVVGHLQAGGREKRSS